MIERVTVRTLLKAAIDMPSSSTYSHTTLVLIIGHPEHLVTREGGGGREGEGEREREQYWKVESLIQTP